MEKDLSQLNKDERDWIWTPTHIIVVIIAVAPLVAFVILLLT